MHSNHSNKCIAKWNYLVMLRIFMCKQIRPKHSKQCPAHLRAQQKESNVCLIPSAILPINRHSLLLSRAKGRLLSLALCWLWCQRAIKTITVWSRPSRPCQPIGGRLNPLTRPLITTFTSPSSVRCATTTTNIRWWFGAAWCCLAELHSIKIPTARRINICVGLSWRVGNWNSGAMKHAWFGEMI